MNSYSLIINSVAEKLKSGKKVEEIVNDVIENISKEFNEEIDCNFLYNTFNELNSIRLNTYNCSSKDGLEEAFQNTLKNHGLDTSDNIFVNALRVLSKSDKLIKIDDISYCVKINILLYTLVEYKNAILEYEKLSSLSILLGGIATYSNSDISECINPRISSLDEVLYLNNNSISTVLVKNILTEFKFDSYNVDFAFYYLNVIGKENINLDSINEEKLDTILNIRKFLNSSTPLKKEDFYKSAQISLLSLYKKYNFTDMSMGYKTKLSQSKIMDSINIIMEYCLDMPKSSIYNKCFTKPVQLKSYFFSTPIYEYRTNENVKLHPVFENEQELKTILRTIQ